MSTASESQDFPLQANLLSTPQAIKDLLHKFSPVVYSNGFPASEPRHHTLTNPGLPVFAKPYHLDPEKLASPQAAFSSMEKAGIICRSNSPRSSPLHMVKKKDSGWRPCGNYCCLNTTTVPDCYPLPNISDFTSRISCFTVFSKLDLQNGYNLVPMNKEDI